MQIKDIFKKDISRPINGVVKADQLDESVVWQELDEYVVTRELDQYLRKFISAYLSSVDMPGDLTIRGRMGVWVSGFFGSGKSHFIKILSYLLGNRNTINPETNAEKRAIDFFYDKIEDPMLLADLKRIAGINADIMLFNIDSRADASNGRSTILYVFWRVFNESQGLCGEYLYLAEIERYLVKKGKYDEFKNKFYEIHGSKWEDERDAYALYQDEIVKALSSVLDKSKHAASDWLEKSEQNFNLTVENFAKQVKEYLDTKSKNHRIVFLVDEIGQFIGNDTHLMLNLQTIVEDLGRICNGQVWVVVTSQEDIDKVLGDIKASKANDFSKIQGRFYTRLSLSSSNTDEVIQTRLLEKTEDAEAELENLFSEKGDILKNQLSFSHNGTTLKKINDAKGFITNYPFAPFHFQLVQNIFESIRKRGASGLHLARGERSMLDAFQSAAISLSSKNTGTLVPLYEFFPCIENFLDTTVMLSINNAKDNTSLEMPFDIQLLQTLFLIRYVEIIKPNVNNLVTFCIDEVDADRINLKQKIEASLERLEKQNLISRNGDLYFFLTNDEREVSREIKSVEVPSAAETQLLGDIIFDDILKSKTKYRYTPYKTDYTFNRVCDGRYWGKELKDEMGLEIISPLHDEYSLFIPAKCNLYSSNKEGHIIVKLADDRNLISGIRTYLQTEKYIRDKSDASASTCLKQILRDRADENRSRKQRLIGLVDNLMAQAEYYALGRRLEIKAQITSKAVEEAFDHLVRNIFSKFSYLTSVPDEPIKEIKHIIESDDIAMQQMVMDFEKAEPTDIKEIKTVIELKTASSQPIILADLVRHFTKRPYGWGDLQVIILIAKFYMAGKINLIVDGRKIKPKDAIALLTKTHQWKNVKIIRRKEPPEKEIKKTRVLAKDLFGSIAPEGQDQLIQFIRKGLKKWGQTLEKFKPLADTGNYPGKKEIDACLEKADKLLNIHDDYELVKEFNENKDDLQDASDDLHNLKDFYTNQKNAWETLRSAMDRFKPNWTALGKVTDAGKSLQRMSQILNAASPYKMLKEVNTLISKVETVNESLIKEKRTSAVFEIEKKISHVSDLLNEKNSEDDFCNKTLFPLQDIKKKIRSEYSIPQISYSVNEAQELFEEALENIDEAFNPDPEHEEKPKQIKTIKPASFKQKLYLETEDDVDAFVNKVRNELLEAVKNNIRVRIE
ncbi:MAG: BREX system P-loop protein BrxC [Deltaproteobacteria bacterium]|jgi:hypothetical protein|nr:BREX system P-loop protein BrxC [Deltaproteobacteria bacterium]MDL1987115.1 BREX system P-loop protein BrxC [Deltaproteobacteria bacterium]